MIDRAHLELALGAAEAPELLALAGELQGRAWARLSPAPAKIEDPDANITVTEAARRLGISADYLYRNRRALPFITTIGRRVVCSARGLAKYQTTRMNGGSYAR